ncbi:MAG: hypothetical protein D6739_12315 [Nitrospirae bacterium]|nr:MAG: hypothetical protein D6739_12315 [Nitrospirota bacterium]
MGFRRDPPRLAAGRAPGLARGVPGASAPSPAPAAAAAASRSCATTRRPPGGAGRPAGWSGRLTLRRRRRVS